MYYRLLKWIGASTIERGESCLPDNIQVLGHSVPPVRRRKGLMKRVSIIGNHRRQFHREFEISAASSKHCISSR
jgi:hypothetical protein